MFALPQQRLLPGVLRGKSLSALLPDYSDRVAEKDRALLKADVFWHHALVSTDRYFT